MLLQNEKQSLYKLLLYNNMNICKNCRKKFPYRIKNGLVNGFCNDGCEEDYKNVKLPWQKKNKDKYNNYMRNYYKRNKNKTKSRCLTYQLLCPVNLDCKVKINRFCKDCDSFDDLEIHHEEYPDNVKDIIKSISAGRIYFLCRRCHTKITNGKTKSI